jgi:hypothetical protein
VAIERAENCRWRRDKRNGSEIRFADFKEGRTVCVTQDFFVSGVRQSSRKRFDTPFRGFIAVPKDRIERTRVPHPRRITFTPSSASDWLVLTNGQYTIPHKENKYIILRANVDTLLLGVRSSGHADPSRADRR